jgi:hypothetical protein
MAAMQNEVQQLFIKHLNLQICHSHLDTVTFPPHLTHIRLSPPRKTPRSTHSEVDPGARPWYPRASRWACP